jgi:hypothetical protein
MALTFAFTVGSTGAADKQARASLGSTHFLPAIRAQGSSGTVAAKAAPATKTSDTIEDLGPIVLALGVDERSRAEVLKLLFLELLNHLGGCQSGL